MRGNNQVSTDAASGKMVMHSSRRAVFTVTASVTVTRSPTHLGEGRLGHGLCKAGLVGEEGALDLLEGVERGNREVALHGEFASDGLGGLFLLVAFLLLSLLEGFGLLLDRALDEASPGAGKSWAQDLVLNSK